MKAFAQKALKKKKLLHRGHLKKKMVINTYAIPKRYEKITIETNIWESKRSITIDIIGTENNINKKPNIRL